MLLRPDGDGAVLAIGQASHAWLSGQLARAWGNERFAPPEPHEEVCLGAAQHDIGMAAWDRTPARHPDTGLPREFFAMDRRTHLALWAAAPDLLLTQSVYAALLVSRHGTGLLERFPPRVDGDPELAQIVADHLRRERRRQRRLAAALDADEAQLARNQALLAAWDDLSLALCRDRLPHAVPDVPVAGEARSTLRLSRGAGEGLHLEPWPLRRPTLTLHVEGRRLVGVAADEAELHTMLDRAPLVRLTLRLAASG